MEWEKLPNGKWRPKKQFKKTIDGKYQWDDPRYMKMRDEKMKKVVSYCEYCRDYYNLLEPCVHHLPDNYKNQKIKEEAYKQLRYKPERNDELE